MPNKVVSTCRRNRDDFVGAAVVDEGAAVDHGGAAGEDDVRHVALAFPRFCRFEDEPLWSADDTGWVVPVEQGNAEAVDAILADAVVNAELACVGQHWRPTGADLELVPVPRPRVHDLPIVAPVDQVV